MPERGITAAYRRGFSLRNNAGIDQAGTDNRNSQFTSFENRLCATRPQRSFPSILYEPQNVPASDRREGEFLFGTRNETMNWTPISEQELATMIADAVSIMEPQACCLWDLIRVSPTKWTLHPWGDQGGGFWVVAIVGMQVVWYNDIEDGFNVSRYATPGVINDYWCNQDELQHTIYALLRQIETGETLGRFGPPEPLT